MFYQIGRGKGGAGEGMRLGRRTIYRKGVQVWGCYLNLKNSVEVHPLTDKLTDPPDYVGLVVEEVLPHL